MTREQLLVVLTNYEGAIQANEEEHSEETILELEKAREDLMDVLLAAKKMTESPVADWDRDTGNGFNERGYPAGHGTYHDPMR